MKETGQETPKSLLEGVIDNGRLSSDTTLLHYYVCTFYMTSLFESGPPFLPRDLLHCGRDSKPLLTLR